MKIRWLIMEARTTMPIPVSMTTEEK